MEKYKNKKGIELSYTNDNDVHQVLVKEVIGEAIKILGMYDKIATKVVKSIKEEIVKY